MIPDQAAWPPCRYCGRLVGLNSSVPGVCGSCTARASAVSKDEWLTAREAEIAAIQPMLMCRVFADDAPNIKPPCNALTPSMVHEMLYSRTGIRGWRVRLVAFNLLEVLPPVWDGQ